MRNSRFIQNSLRRVLSLVLLAGIPGGPFSVPAQTRRPAGRAKTSAPKTGATTVKPTQPSVVNRKATCNGWSGVVTYQKTQNYKWDGGKKNTVRGTFESRKSDEYKYTGRIVVDGSTDPNNAVTRAQVLFNETGISWGRGEQVEDCAHDRVHKPQVQWFEDDDRDITNAFYEGISDNFRLDVNESAGTYDLSFGFPDIKGIRDIARKRTSGGWCTADWNKPETYTSKDPATVGGQGAEIKGQKLDPNNPNVISGSSTWQEGSMPSTTYTYKVTWSFKSCPSPVEVTDIRFDEHPYPDPDTWKEIDPSRGTVDGNRVRIRATVTNFSSETKFPRIKFNELVENWVLPDGETSIRLDPAESREVTLEWDAAGYAWKGTGRAPGRVGEPRAVLPESKRRIKVEADDDGRISELTKQVVVNPRPVMLVHGLWTDKRVWANYGTYLSEGHSAAWKAFAYDPDLSETKTGQARASGHTARTMTVADNAKELQRQVEGLRRTMSAWHVDVVAHSVGGLIARYYIDGLMPRNPLGRKPAVTKLIMLGTPNAGTPCATIMHAALSQTGNNVEALRELTPENMEKFNAKITRRHGVRFTAVAGKAIPSACQEVTWGDGMVPYQSAKFNILDWDFSGTLTHTDLTGRDDFYGTVAGRLAVGPRGNHDPDLANDDYGPDGSRKASALPRDFAPGAADRNGFKSYFRKASYSAGAVRDADGGTTKSEANVEGLTLAKQVRLAPNQTTEVEIPMREGSRAAVVFLAPPNVSATLLDATGNVVGRNTAGTPESKLTFRTIAVERAVTNGTWKLKLESREATETDVLLAAFCDPNPLALSITAGRPTATKQVSLQAKLTKNTAPVAGAVVRARIDSAGGQSVKVDLLDDGSHEDGAAGDGVYGARLEKLADGDYLVEARAETDGRARSAGASFSVRAETKPAAGPAAKTGKR